MDEKIRNLLKNDPYLNPFNDKFGLDKFSSFKKLDLSYEDEVKNILHTTIWLNQIHKEFYQELAKLIKTTDSEADKVVDLIFVGFNRNYLVMHHQGIEEMKNEGHFNMLEFHNKTLSSKNPNIGNVGLTGMLETEIDSLNITTNLLRHLINTPFDKIVNSDPLQPVLQLQLMHMMSAIYQTVKSIYEDGIWNGGTIAFDVVAQKITVCFPNSKRLHLKNIGNIRMQTISFHALSSLSSRIENNALLKMLFQSRLKNSRKNKLIKSVSIKEGKVLIQLKNVQELPIPTNLLMKLAVVECFYPFLNLYEVLPNSKGLSVWDYMLLLSYVQEIFDEVLKLEIDTSLYSLNDLQKYPIKIPKSELENYLQESLHYNYDQVSYFIDTFTCSLNGRFNLWSSPLLMFESHFYVSYLPLMAPQIVNLIDNWLNKSGFLLDKRGKLFENYIGLELKRIFSKKKYYFQLEERKKISLNGKTEEIDLIFSLKKIVFVAEVKCMKLATTPREDNNAFNTLRTATTQVLRKLEFLKDRFTSDKELSEMLTGRKLVPLIITNYPSFTGLEINNVPVVDFFLLESYFGTGTRSSGYIENNNGKTRVVSTEFHKEYNNEEELNERVESFIKNPTHIADILKKCAIETKNFVPKDLAFSLYAEYSRMQE